MADNEGFASGVTVARGNVSGAPALLQELLDHAQGNPVTTGNLLTVSPPFGRRKPRIRSRKSKEIVRMPISSTPPLMATVLFKTL